MSMTLTSVSLALESEGSTKPLIRNPSPVQCQNANSVHILAFTSEGDLIVAESEGTFSLDEWDEIYEVGKAMCCDNSIAAADNTMQEGTVTEEAGIMSQFVKSTIQAKVATDLHWKD